jgi:hypothetical protein
MTPATPTANALKDPFETLNVPKDPFRASAVSWAGVLG